MLKARTTKQGSFQMYCDCGCGEGITLYYDREPSGEDDPVAYLSMVTSHFYAEQDTFLDRFLKKLKRIWFILRNKEYTYFEIVLTASDVEEFKRFVSRM